MNLWCVDYLSLMKYFNNLVFLKAQCVRNPPAIQETQQIQIWSLGWEDSPGGGNGNPLQYSCLRNLWTEEPGGKHFTNAPLWEQTCLRCCAWHPQREHQSWLGQFQRQVTRFSWELPVLTWLWIFESSSLSQAEVHPSLTIQPFATWKSQTDLDFEGSSSLFSSECSWDLVPDGELHTFLCRVMASLQFKGCGACVLSCFSPVRLFATLWTIACQAPVC